MKRRLIIVSERNIDDSQSSIASGTPQRSAETPQYDPETPLSFDDYEALQNDLVGMDLNFINSSLGPQDNIASGGAQYPEAEVQNYESGIPHSSTHFLIDQSSDPMLSGPQGESSELFQEIFRAYQ
ncbi:hypothetical protein AB205_0006560 [Aquarana catesbeiana]|uniref:Uncharacterized protein n=1 Tax=Aquarana catesbeiana TaxID=8400 RepID=A0A2G9S4U0_AQUCT|nr:hypothetical protein AB205_0006560 [Aquarana catesbeiana]